MHFQDNETLIENHTAGYRMVGYQFWWSNWMILN